MTRGVLYWVTMMMSLVAETLEIEARLLVSTPTPELREIAPYPQALCTSLYKVVKVHSGKYADDKILVVKWAVWDREKIDGLPEKAGTVERMTVERWIDQPKFDRERIVDAIRDVDRVIYYDPSSKPAELPGVGALLKERGTESDTGVVRGEREGWLFLGEELRHAGIGRFWDKDWKKVSRAGIDPLPAMLDFQRRLKELGVRLLVVPVPTKVSIYPECLAEKVKVRSQTEYVKRLELAGLDVLDLESVFKVEKTAHKLYCAQDSHWTPQACALAAREICRRLEVAPPELPEVVEIGSEKAEEIRGDLANMLASRKPAPEKILFSRYRFTDDRKNIGLQPPKGSTILLGDSHITVFSDGSEEMHGAGAGLPDHLLANGMPVDVIASYGDGVHQARVNLYQRSVNPKHPAYWENKKWVVWVFSAREFTRAKQWSTKIPVVKKR